MQSNRKYAFMSIVTQMVILPAALTIILILGISLNIFDSSRNEILGKNAVNLIYLLLILVCSLITGLTSGIILSKLFKAKPLTSKERYLPILFPSAYALFFAAICIIFSKGNYNSAWWSLYVFKNPMFLIFDFAAAFSGLTFIIPVAEISSCIGFTAGTFLHASISRTSLKTFNAKIFKMFAAVMCILFVILVSVSSSDIIQNGIIEFKYGKATIGNELTEFDLLKIAPFKDNNGLAKLDGKASLDFKSLDMMPRLDGATAVYPVYASFVQAVYSGLGDYYWINRNNTDKNIDLAFVSSPDYPLNIVSCSKTPEAYERLISGKVDIIFTAEPSKAQNDMVKAKGDEFILTPIGNEAFVFFTNIENPIENLTTQQIRDIYSGKTTNWKSLGGLNKKILPYQRPENSGSQTIMQNKVMKDVKMLEPTKETYAGGMGEIISHVASYKNAKNSIGYSFMYYSSSMIRNNQIKYISVDGIKPAPDTVKNKKYPFTIPVYAVTLKSNSNKNVQKFIEWILSDEGQSLVEKTGYVPVK